MSWNDVDAYARWLSQQTGQNYRLPTEAEWEYAARAGTNTKYWWGNEIGSNKANCWKNQCGDNFEYTAPVGSFMANAFGLHDTAGNVWEWTCSEKGLWILYPAQRGPDFFFEKTMLILWFYCSKNGMAF